MIRYLSGVFILIFTLIFYSSLAQTLNLHEPIDFQQALKAQTRAEDGKPGPSYWQNHADYNIVATLKPEENLLEGKAQITYFNNSPNTLNSITFRLYQDRYKKGTIRNSAVHPDDVHDGVDVSKILIDGETYLAALAGTSPTSITRKGTNLTIQLATPIPSKGKAQIEIDWSFSAPFKTFQRRMGQFRDGAYFMGLWYPEIAVYDDLKGWDNQESHRGVQEFYHDFNDYTVTIHVPEGYMVWATGNHVNESEVFTSDLLEKLEKAKTTDDIVEIVKPEDYDKVLKNAPWKFEATYVPDFAFGAAKNFYWKGGSVVVDSQTNRRVFVDVAYHPDGKEYEKTVELGKEAIHFFSNEFPGVPFPYPHASTFTGIETNGPSMEFPMIANDALYSNAFMFQLAVPHELFHNYFPFYMGINEKHYTWMDEGWAFYSENRFAQSRKSPIAMPFMQFFNNTVGKTEDFPLYTSSLNWGETNMISHYMSKPFVAYKQLEILLGQEKFTKAIQEYMARWNGKHPTPHDFFYSINDFSGEDLNWFWNAYFFEFGYPDLSIKSVTNNSITVQKNSTIPTQVILNITYEDGTNETIKESVRVWKAGSSEYTFETNQRKKITNVQLGNNQIPDADRSNNTWTPE